MKINDDGDMYALGGAIFYKGWLMGSYVALWRGYASFDAEGGENFLANVLNGNAYEGYVLDDVWCISPFVDGKIGNLEIKSTASFLDGNEIYL
jgi:hypothetical protein